MASSIKLGSLISQKKEITVQQVRRQNSHRYAIIDLFLDFASIFLIILITSKFVKSLIGMSHLFSLFQLTFLRFFALN